MNRREYLLTVFMEECAEVAQRAAKMLRFGDTEVEPGQTANNAERLRHEFIHAVTMYSFLEEEGITISINEESFKQASIDKVERVLHFMSYSEQQGMLEPGWRKET